MLSDKEYLMLCQSAISEFDKQGHPLKFDSLIESSYAKSNSKLSEFNLKCTQVLESIGVCTFEDSYGNMCFVLLHIGHPRGSLNENLCNQLVGYIDRNRGPGNCVITGLGVGGMYAAYASNLLKIEGIVFDAPYPQKLPDKVMNKALVFNEDGIGIVDEESDYSRFCSLLINRAWEINGDIWDLFFSDFGKNGLLSGNDFFTLFLKADELNEAGIRSSMEKSVQYIEIQLEKNRTVLKAELTSNKRDFSWADLEREICEVSEKATNNAIDIVIDAYNSVETILLGLGLFSLGMANLNTGDMMNQFRMNVDIVMEKEKMEIAEALKEQTRNLIGGFIP